MTTNISLYNSIPGLTDLSDYIIDNGSYLTSLKGCNKNEKDVILLACNDITENNLFLNGLNQNIIIFYELFESLGYSCYLIQHSNSSSDKDKYLNKYKVILPDNIIRNPLPIKWYIEIGMSLDAVTRSYIRSIGAKIVKIYLGNILNIDIETIQNYKSMMFGHHIVGEIDDVWMSPHYKQNLEYGTVLNQLLVTKGKIVPYVWDSCFINYYGTKSYEWKPLDNWCKYDIVIMDPNISFQKASLYSLLLAEAYHKKYPEWLGNVIIINGDRLNLNSNSKNFILENLSLFKEKRIKLFGRKSIHTVLSENPSATFITCQWNNAFNYMTFELMYCGFPIVHNSDGWEAFGYNYSINKWDEAIETLHNALKNHNQNKHIYKVHTNNLLWKHSIYNPDIQKDWKQILST
jgi:hypothetical protein